MGNHQGLAIVDGLQQVINASAADSGAGAAAPLAVGGEMSIEVVFRPVDGTVLDTLIVLYEAVTPSGTGSILLGYTVPEAAQATVSMTVMWVDETGTTQSVSHPTSGVYYNWTFAIVTLRSDPQTRGVQVAMYSHSNYGTSNTLKIVDNATLPPLTPRHSSIAKASATTKSMGFNGAVDTLRLYPYALTTNEALLQFDMSDPQVITPVVWGHFSMQPYESNEAQFSHRGVASHIGKGSVVRQQPPVRELFPGWAHFNGVNQSIDLTNPANGVNGYWVADVLKGGQAISVEMWFRPDDDGVFTLLDAHPVVRVQVVEGQVLQVGWTSTSGEQSLSVKGAVHVGNWTHLVWTLDSTSTAIRINGNSTLESSVSGTLVSVAPVHGWLARGAEGGWYRGDIGGFRVYPVALTPVQANRLYHAQMDHAPPTPPTPPTQVSSSGGVSSGAAPASSSTGTTEDSSAGVSTESVVLAMGVLLVVLGVAIVAFALYRRKRQLEQGVSGGGLAGTTDERRTTLLSGEVRG